MIGLLMCPLSEYWKYPCFQCQMRTYCWTWKCIDASFTHQARRPVKQTIFKKVDRKSETCIFVRNVFPTLSGAMVKAGIFVHP